MARGMFFQLTLSLIIGLVVETQSGSIYEYDFFDNCGSRLEVGDYDLTRIWVKGYMANTNLCEVTLEAKDVPDDLFYKFTEYSHTSPDVIIYVYSTPTLTGTRLLELTGYYFYSPSLNSNQRGDRFIVIKVTRLGGTDFNAKLEITTEDYNTGPSVSLPGWVIGVIVISCIAVVVIVVVCIVCAMKKSVGARGRVVGTTANGRTGPVRLSTATSTTTNIGQGYHMQTPQQVRYIALAPQPFQYHPAHYQVTTSAIPPQVMYPPAYPGQDQEAPPSTYNPYPSSNTGAHDTPSAPPPSYQDLQPQ